MLEWTHKGQQDAASQQKLCEESGTFCFFQGDSSTSDVLLICGHRQEVGHSLGESSEPTQLGLVCD